MTLTNKRLWHCLAGLLVLIMVLLGLPAPLLKWSIEHQVSAWLGVQVDVASVSFSWWPAQIELEGVDVTNPLQPLQNAVSFTRMQAQLDLPASLQGTLRGTLQVPLLIIEGVEVGKPRQQSGLLATEALPMPFVTNDSSSFRLPANQRPDFDAIVSRETQVYAGRVEGFQRDLQAQRLRWASQLQELPDAADVAAYRDRYASLRGQPALAADMERLRVSLQADLKRFRQIDQQFRLDWQAVQTRYAALKGLAPESLARVLEMHDLADSRLASLGQRLLRERIDQWLNAGVGYHRLLSAQNGSDNVEHAGPARRPLLSIRKAILSGTITSGPRQGQISGEILNLSDSPNWIDEPVTLTINAQGETLGNVQLSVLMDHRTPGKESDDFNFSLKSAHLHTLPLWEQTDLRIALQDVSLSVDASGSIEQVDELALNLTSVIRANTIDVDGEKADNAVTLALADTLRQAGGVTLTAQASGSLTSPVLQLSTTLDEALADAMRAVTGATANEIRVSLQPLLDAALQQQLALLEKDLADTSAMLLQARLRGKAFETLLKTVPTECCDAANE